MLALEIQRGVQTATFESRLLVGGFNPHNPQRYGGSVAENCSTRSRTGAAKSATGVPGMPPSRSRASRVRHLNLLLWFAGSTPQIPSVWGGPWRKWNVARRPCGAPDPHKGAPGGSKQKWVGTLLVFLNVDL